MSGRITFRTQEGKKTLLWLSKDLRTHLDATARANFRSLTAEVHMRLEASIAGESIDEHGVIVPRPRTVKSGALPGGHQ